MTPYPGDPLLVHRRATLVFGALVESSIPIGREEYQCVAAFRCNAQVRIVVVVVAVAFTCQQSSEPRSTTGRNIVQVHQYGGQRLSASILVFDVRRSIRIVMRCQSLSTLVPDDGRRLEVRCDRGQRDFVVVVVIIIIVGSSR